MKIKYPEKIKNIVKGLKYKIDDIGRSIDKVIIFENKYVLKISKNVELLKREYDINTFLKGKIPSSENVAFIIENNYAYYLRTYLDGYSLIDTKYIKNPELLIEALYKTVHILRSLDKYDDCKYQSKESTGISFTHGDLCLPNIYFDENNNFIGFIDLSDAGLGDAWYDYAWMLWSLEYNLKSGKYNEVLLRRLSIPFNKEKYYNYIPFENRKILDNF